MIRPSALNALMIFLGVLAALALLPAIRQGGLDAFLAALPGVTQAIGGLLAIWATYHIAARSEARAKRFEEETAAREARFDERAEERAIRADEAADRRMRNADRAAEDRMILADKVAVSGLVSTTRALVFQAIEAIDFELKELDMGEGGMAGRLGRKLDLAIAAIDAVAGVPVRSAPLLLAVFDIRQIMTERPIWHYGTGGQTMNRAGLERLKNRLEVAERGLALKAQE